MPFRMALIHKGLQCPSRVLFAEVEVGDQRTSVQLNGIELVIQFLRRFTLLIRINHK